MMISSWFHISYVCIMLLSRVKVGHTCWPTWSTDPQKNMDVTYIWSTCWSFLFKNVKWRKNQIWNNGIDFFILGRIQNWSMHRNLENELLDTTCFKTKGGSKLVSGFTCLLDANIFSKDHVMYQNLDDIQTI